MKETSLLEVVDEYVLTEYLDYNNIKYIVSENPFDDETVYNDYDGNVKIICNVKLIEDIRRFEANHVIDNLFECEELKNWYKLIINFNSITEYLRYNFDKNILISEIENAIKPYQYDVDFISQLLSLCSTINNEIYEKYKVFYERDLYDVEDNDEDDGCNGFILDFDIEENDQ